MTLKEQVAPLNPSATIHIFDGGSGWLGPISDIPKRFMDREVLGMQMWPRSRWEPFNLDVLVELAPRAK